MKEGPIHWTLAHNTTHSRGPHALIHLTPCWFALGTWWMGEQHWFALGEQHWFALGTWWMGEQQRELQQSVQGMCRWACAVAQGLGLLGKKCKILLRVEVERNGQNAAMSDGLDTKQPVDLGQNASACSGYGQRSAWPTGICWHFTDKLPPETIDAHIRALLKCTILFFMSKAQVRT